VKLVRATSIRVMTPDSPLAAAVARVGDRWSLLIVDVLQAGPRRFNDLMAQLPGLAPNVLSQRLKHLEREAIVVARPYQHRPPRFSYELTAAGSELVGVLQMLAQWGARRSPHVETPTHAACGTPLEVRLYCPTCARTVSDQEDAELRFL
jgi:DNA-binding HxlR family transcriptional regulator